MRLVTGEEHGEKEEGELTDVDAIMREVGLVSGSDSDKSIWSSEREPLSPKLGAPGRAKKRQKLGLTDESGFSLSLKKLHPHLATSNPHLETAASQGSRRAAAGRSTAH